MEQPLYPYIRIACSLKRLWVFAILMLAGLMAFAEIKLPALIANGMVLQQKNKCNPLGLGQTRRKDRH